VSEPENYAEAVAWFNECKKRRVRDKARIAELEALVNANTDHMTEVGVEACRERDTRIAELEAHAADCKRLVTSCENDLDAERMKRREVEAELKSAKHLNAKWMDERTTALMDKEQAEAALAERDKVIDAMEDFIDSCTYHMRDGDTVNYTGPRAEEAKP